MALNGHKGDHQENPHIINNLKTNIYILYEKGIICPKI